MAITVADVTKAGIYRSDTGVIDALDPMISIVTVQLIKNVASTTQRIGLPTSIDVKGVIGIRNGSENGIDGGVYGNNNKTVGFADGTDEICFNYMIDGETDPANLDANHSHSNITFTRRQQVQSWASPPEMGFTVTALGTGYIDIQTTQDNSGGQDLWITIIAFGGNEVENFKVWDTNLGTGTSAITVSGIGAIPSLVLTGGVDESTTLAAYNDVTLGSESEARSIFGFALADGSQGCIGMQSNHNLDPVEISTLVSNTKCLVGQNTAGSLKYSVTAGNFQSGSFDITPSANASSAVIGGAAVTFSDDISLKIVDVEIPTIGDYTQSDVGFKSKLGMLFLQDGPTAYDTATSAGFSCEVMTVFDENIQYCHTFPVQEGVDSWANLTTSAISTTLTVHRSDTEAGGAAPSAIYASSGHTVNSTGWVTTTTTSPATAIKGVALAIG